MTNLLTILGVKTLLLTLFGLGVWLILSVLRVKSARIVIFSWELVLAIGILGAAIPVGIPWKVEKKSEPIVKPVYLNKEIKYFDKEKMTAPPVYSRKSNLEEIQHQWVKAWQIEPQPKRIEIFTFANMITALCTLWLAGIAFFITMAMIAQWRVRKDLKTAIKPKGDDLTEWEEIRTDSLISADRVQLLLTHKTGPALIGRFPNKAIIAIPIEFWSLATPEVRRGIIQHELTHWRQGDLIRCFFAQVILLIHWFNPIAHLAVRRMTEAMESICDAAAFGKDELGVKRFLESMLIFYDTSPVGTVLQNSFARSNLTRRLKCLQYRSRDFRESLRKKGAVFAIVLAAFGFFLTIYARERTDLLITPNVAQKIDHMRKILEHPSDAERNANRALEAGISVENIVPSDKIFESGNLPDEHTPQISLEFRFLTLPEFPFAEHTFESGWVTGSLASMQDKRPRSKPNLPSSENYAESGQSIHVGLIQSGTVPTFLRCIEAKTFENIQAACGEFVSTNILQAPQMTLSSGQEGNVSDIMEIPFVESGITVHGEYGNAIQPLVSIHEEGLRVTVLPEQTENGRVRFDRLSVEIKQIFDKDDTVKFGNVTFQTPTCSVVSFNLEKIEIADSMSLLIALPLKKIQRAVLPSNKSTLNEGTYYLMITPKKT